MEPVAGRGSLLEAPLESLPPLVRLPRPLLARLGLDGDRVLLATCCGAIGFHAHHEHPPMLRGAEVLAELWRHGLHLEADRPGRVKPSMRGPVRGLCAKGNATARETARAREPRRL